MSDAQQIAHPKNRFIDKRDDMYDEKDDLEKAGLLARALQHWSQLADAYWQENHQAIEEQKWHRWIVSIAVWTGTIAVILAIAQLLFRDHDFLTTFVGWSAEKTTWKIAFIEFIAAMAAAATVLWGVLSRMQEEWLLKRHKAERMRMLKYRSLLQYAADCMSNAALTTLKEDAKSQLHRIQDTDQEGLESWISVNQTWEEDLEPKKDCLDKAEMKEFLEYYRRKRLDAQTGYFNSKAKKAEQRDSVTRLLPPFLFVASIACAAAHFGIDAFHHGTTTVGGSSQPDTMAVLLIVGAASFPILGAAIRTYRSAYEFSRNSKRFRATYTDLHRTGGSVKDKDKPPEAILKELWKAEESLEREHREWLRLMVEAEWYA